MKAGQLIRIEASHFVAGFVVDEETGLVIDAAPILSWSIGKEWREVLAYISRKKWRYMRL